jgi:phosphatidylethanolamine N-methyltransferase
MKERVDSFPFNVTENPMYTGSTMVFLAEALREGSVAGLVMTLWVFFCYQIALLFEGFGS